MLLTALNSNWNEVTKSICATENKPHESLNGFSFVRGKFVLGIHLHMLQPMAAAF